MDRSIRDIDDVLNLLDRLFDAGADRWTGRGATWWDEFYQDRSRDVPFFVDKPDENLISYVDRGLLPAGGRALDLGCGPGRNTAYLAAAGFEVDGVDLSVTAIEWARQRTVALGLPIRLHHADVFDLADQLHGRYDLIYDSGCFHHLPPHRRVSYRALLGRLLAPGGFFGLSCFAAGAMGSERPDDELYRDGRLDGGLAYTPEALRWIFADLTEVELRRMHDESAESPTFGVPFLWAALFRRPEAGTHSTPAGTDRGPTTVDGTRGDG